MADEVMPRVRTFDSTISVFLKTERERSMTFDNLIGRINHTDGLVYVYVGKCPHRIHACFPYSVRLAGPNRLLRIIVDARRPPQDVAASIAHELTHAMEVLAENGIRDDLAIFNFYYRNGVKRGEAFETYEAIETELKVRSELGRDFDEFFRRKAAAAGVILD